MKSTVLWALIVLNVLLLAAFFGRFTSDNSAIAQTARRPGDYVMIAGEVTGGNSGVVYMVDTTNGLLGAITFDENAKRLVTMPKVDLASIMSRGAAGNTESKPRPR